MRKSISSSQNALSEIKKSFPPKLQKIFTNDIQTDEMAINEEEDGDQVSLTRALNNHHYSLFQIYERSSS